MANEYNEEDIFILPFEYNRSAATVDKSEALTLISGSLGTDQIVVDTLDIDGPEELHLHALTSESEYSSVNTIPDIKKKFKSFKSHYHSIDSNSTPQILKYGTHTIATTPDNLPYPSPNPPCTTLDIDIEQHKESTYIPIQPNCKTHTYQPSQENSLSICPEALNNVSLDISPTKNTSAFNHYNIQSNSCLDNSILIPKIEAIFQPNNKQSLRNYKCPHCHLSFRRNHDLQRHCKTHLKTPPYSCPDCTKRFSRKDALKVR